MSNAFKSMDDYVAKGNVDIAAITPGGKMQPTQMLTYVKTLTKRSVLLQLCNVLDPLPTREWRQPKIGFGDSFIVAPDHSLQETPEAWRATPQFDEITLNCMPFKVVAQIPDDTLREVVERNGFIDYLIPLIAEASASDVEKIIIQGDTTITPVSLETASLSQMDGLIKKAVSHVYNAAGQFPSPTILDEIELEQPEQYRALPGTAVLMSSDALIQYRRIKAARPTPGGDAQLTKALVDDHHGVKIYGIPLFPTTTVGSQKHTVALRCVPEHIFVGFQDNMKIELQRNADAGSTKVVVRSQFDSNFKHLEGVVKAIGLRSR